MPRVLPSRRVHSITELLTGVSAIRGTKCSQRSKEAEHLQPKTPQRDFPGDPGVSNPPANAGDMGSSLGPGIFYLPRRDEAHAPQRLKLRSRAWKPQRLKPTCPEPTLSNKRNPRTTNGEEPHTAMKPTQPEAQTDSTEQAYRPGFSGMGGDLPDSRLLGRTSDRSKSMCSSAYHQLSPTLSTHLNVSLYRHLRKSTSYSLLPPNQSSVGTHGNIQNE